MMRIACLLLLSCLLPACHLSMASAQTTISIEQSDEKITVKIGNELFTQYVYRGFDKPFLYPVLAPGGVGITRNYPMQSDVAGEAKDHPHHKSIWFAHGDVNGVEFWNEDGHIVLNSIDEILPDGFVATHDWTSGESRICSDRTTIRFAFGEAWRTIDYEIALIASQGELKFGDTKEGTFAIRTHPALRIKGADGQPQATAINSNGVRGKDIWGKSAKWVHYAGEIDETSYSVTMIDHPGNLRHPTTWHARDYGLVAANPFGWHYFKNVEHGAGDYTLPAGQQLLLQYRVFIKRGEMTAADAEAEFEKFAR